MITILTIGSEYRSAVKIGFPTTTDWYEDISQCNPKNVVIRWGNSGMFEDAKDNEIDFARVLNPGKAIHTNCHKNLALELMAKVVNTPTQYKEKVPNGISAVVRHTNHSGGNGFNVLQGPLKLKLGQYATKYINTKTEYRVWFCGDKTMCAKRVTKAKVSPPYCRSQWGYRFCRMNAALHNQALAAAKSIGLDCGAADILQYRGKYYFLENNSAPTLDHSKLVAFYRTNLVELIKSKWPDVTIPKLGEQD